MKVFTKDGIYIPIKHVTPERYTRLEKALTKDLFTSEQACEKCEYFPERVCEVCETCPNYGGRLVLLKEVVKKDSTYLRIPYGSTKLLNKVFDSPEIVSKNKIKPMSKRIKFTGEPRDYQTEAVTGVLKKKSGVLKSPPRSGKTIMGAMIIAKLGVKTIIMAKQNEWLDNFKETFVGSKTQKALTDISPKKIGRAKTLEDFQKFDICLVTYQLFISPKGKDLLEKIKGMFSLLLIDEVQTANANVFASVTSKLEFEYGYGLSGTPQRKDCLAKGTLVLTPEGNVPIESLGVGDLVCTLEGDFPVSNTYTRDAGLMVRVNYENGHIDCTPDHEFWVQNRKSWVSAKDLKPSDNLVFSKSKNLPKS